MNFFLKKQLIKFSCTYQPLSFYKNFKKFLRANPELWCAIFGHKMAHLSWTFFFLVQTIIITFTYLLALFTVQNLQNSYSGSRVMRMHHFCDQYGPFASIFFWKTVNIILIYLLATLIMQNFIKILPADPELWGCATFGPKMAHFPK